VLTGGGLQAGGSVAGVGGLSGDATKARNLRGKNIAVPGGKTSLDIRFPQEEDDGNYAIFVEQNWLTNRAISNKTATGFATDYSAGRCLASCNRKGNPRRRSAKASGRRVPFP
jgi:hypothetical protein